MFCIKKHCENRLKNKKGITGILPIAKIKKLIILFVLAAVFIWIFMMSDKPATESQFMSRKIDLWLCTTFVKDYQNITIEEQQIFLDVLDLYVRKSAHFLEYTVLGAVLYLALGFVFERRKIQIMAVFFVGILQAALDEVHQYFVVGRTARAADVLLDGTGVCAGIFLSWICLVFFTAARKQISKPIDMQ